MAELIAFTQGVLGVGDVGSPHLRFRDWLSLLNYVLQDIACWDIVVDRLSEDSSSYSLGALVSFLHVSSDLSCLSLLVSHLLLPFVAIVRWPLKLSYHLLKQLETTS